MKSKSRVVVIIPAYKAATTINEVIENVLPMVDGVIVVVDGCPETNAALRNSATEKVHVLIREENGGVGAAMKEGFRFALEMAPEIVIKIDADNQMDPQKIPALVRPIRDSRADITKGNRFASPAHVRGMPPIRMLGNAFLSLFTKFSSGYWSVNDPTNGFIALSLTSLTLLEYEKLANGYFFESDLLHRAGIAQLVVKDIPMYARYPSQGYSNLRVGKTLFSFPALHMRNFLRRVLYKYYLKEWSLATFELPLGIILMSIGVTLGIGAYFVPNSIGALTAQQAVFVAIGLISGLQLLLSWLHYDIETEPAEAVGFQD